MNRALRSLIYAMNPNSTKEDESHGTDCCICLNAMAPFQALFLAPCSHVFHYKCATPLLGAGFMFQCPICRQVANLEASVQEPEGIEKLLQEEEEEDDDDGDEEEFVGRGKTLGRRIGPISRVTESQGSLVAGSEFRIEERGELPEPPLSLVAHSAPVSIPGSVDATPIDTIMSPSTPRDYSAMSQAANRPIPSNVTNSSNQLMDSLAKVINAATTHNVTSMTASVENYNVQLKQILEQAIGDDDLQQELLSRLSLNLNTTSNTSR
jgi:hypothetical protein